MDRVLARVDQRLFASRVAGETLAEAGARAGRSTAGAYRRLRELGSGLADRAGIDVDTAKDRRARKVRATA